MLFAKDPAEQKAAWGGGGGGGGGGGEYIKFATGPIGATA